MPPCEVAVVRPGAGIREGVTARVRGPSPPLISERVGPVPELDRPGHPVHGDAILPGLVREAGDRVEGRPAVGVNQAIPRRVEMDPGDAGDRAIGDPDLDRHPGRSERPIHDGADRPLPDDVRPVEEGGRGLIVPGARARCREAQPRGARRGQRGARGRRLRLRPSRDADGRLDGEPGLIPGAPVLGPPRIADRRQGERAPPAEVSNQEAVLRRRRRVHGGLCQHHEPPLRGRHAQPVQEGVAGVDAPGDARPVIRAGEVARVAAKGRPGLRVVLRVGENHLPVPGVRLGKRHPDRPEVIHRDGDVSRGHLEGGVGPHGARRRDLAVVVPLRREGAVGRVGLRAHERNPRAPQPPQGDVLQVCPKVSQHEDAARHEDLVKAPVRVVRRHAGLSAHEVQGLPEVIGRPLTEHVHPVSGAINLERDEVRDEKHLARPVRPTKPPHRLGRG